MLIRAFIMLSVVLGATLATQPSFADEAKCEKQIYEKGWLLKQDLRQDGLSM